MAQRWVTEEELNSMQNQYAEGGNVQESNPLMEFYNQLPPELQEKIQMLPPEKQQEVLIQLMQKYQEQGQQQFQEGGEVNPQQIMQMVAQALQQGMQPEEIVQMLVEQGIPQEQAMQIIQQVVQEQPQEQQFAMGGKTQGIPVEAERNENITVQDGQQPQVDGGYLEQQSHNPITGQSTYEIPDNGHSETHDNGGVNMQLSEGDVVNSDKTKIPIDFKIYGKSFKNKTFKDASDYLSKQENKVQDDYANRIKEGKTDKVSDGTLQIILAKLGKSRNELNELQEQVLESKKQKEANDLLKSSVAEYGKVVLEMNKAEHGFNSSLDRYLNYKVTDRPVMKAADGLNASLEKFSKFADKVQSNPNSSIQDIMNAYKQSGLSVSPQSSYKNSKNSISFDYKPKNVTIPKQEIFSSIHSASNKYGIDPALMFTMADIESSFNPNATSKTGAAGLFQFTKGTGKQYGIEGEKRYDLNANADAGARLLLDNQKILIKNGIEPTPVYTYLAHQLGAGGAIQLYNNITKGTPIPASTMSNMGLNFGKKSAEQYLAETTKKVMSRYDGYTDKLQEKDANLSLDAHQIKQQYQLPYQPEEIKSDLYNFGIKGITEKLKANSYKPTTTNTPQQSSNFAYGGKIYAPEGVTVKGQENWAALNKKAQEQGVNQFANPTEYQNYMWENYPDLVESLFNEKIWKNTQKGRIGEGRNIDYPTYNTSQAENAFKDGLFEYRGVLPKEQTFTNQDDLNVFMENNTPLVGGKYYMNPKDNNSIIIPKLSLSNSYGKPWIPSTKMEEEIPGEYPPTDNAQIVNGKLRDVNKKRAVGGVHDIEEKTSWMDKLTYGAKQAIPLLSNIALAAEEQFNPVLQQKPYDNPYDNMRTDTSIQSNLDDNYRALLTQMADERGNPSVRSARLAQGVANMQNINNQLYTQKYNQDLALENQKTIGQSQYRGQLDDINRGLRKQHEQEILQTKEVGRQQKNMAIDNMANNYLRKQEENQAINLSLLETDYTFNPITGKYEIDPKKREANFARLKYLSKNQPTESTKKEKGEKTYVFRDGQFIPIGKYGLKV